MLPLHDFKQLRSLDLRGVDSHPNANCVDALSSPPSLISLELKAYETVHTEQLTSALHRLCHTQLQHLTLPVHQLCQLIRRHQDDLRMFTLLSLTVTPDDFRATEILYPEEVADSAVIFGCFPSLQHLAVGSDVFLRHFSAVDLPSLSTFIVRDRVLRCKPDSVREQMRHTLMRAPSMQHLTLSIVDSDGTGACTVFPSPVETSSLSQLVYLQFHNGLTLADLRYLLTSSSPPQFAARLQTLTLRVRDEDRSAAASLLPSLPLTYPSLTRANVGLQRQPRIAVKTVCAVWDAAVMSLQLGLGSVWCVDSCDVVCWRDDVVWRRSAGLHHKCLAMLVPLCERCVS